MELRAEYDADAEVVYVPIKKGQPAHHSVEEPCSVVLRYNEANELIGFTFLL